jgi:hypothetical protein
MVQSVISVETSNPYEIMLKDYRELVCEWAQEYNYVLSEHAIDIASKILAHRDKALPYRPGSFIQAFLDNNLEKTVKCMGPELKPYFWTIFWAWHGIYSYHIKLRHFPEEEEIDK